MIVNKDNIHKLVPKDNFFKAIVPPEVVFFLKVNAALEVEVSGGKRVLAKPRDILVKYQNGELGLFDPDEFNKKFRVFKDALRLIK